MKFAKESWLIIAIGLADLITTIIFIQHHGAEEANPLFKRYWEMGIPVFIFAKLALLFGPLWVLEWARKRNPVFVSWALRSAIAAYLVLYGVGFARLNSPAAHPEEVVLNTAPAPDSLVAQYDAYKGSLTSFHNQLKARHQLLSRDNGPASRSSNPNRQRSTAVPPESIHLIHPSAPIVY